MAAMLQQTARTRLDPDAVIISVLAVEKVQEVRFGE
jgi:hypothetical protein